MNPRKVLIIEDDPVTALAHRNRLLRDGYEVQTAPDGEQGLQVLSTFRPDALLLDLNLPGLSGLEVLATIRASEEFRRLPILVFTSTLTAQIQEQCVKTSADRVFEKGKLSVAVLLEALQEVCVRE